MLIIKPIKLALSRLEVSSYVQPKYYGPVRILQARLELELVSSSNSSPN
jgi:hypothetical protein